jgi:hypothetical protein
VDALAERYLAKAEEYERLARQAHDPMIVYEYQDLARQMRELAFQVERYDLKL